MKDFFDLLADFLDSDLAKNYYWFFVICAVMIAIVAGIVVWLYASKIHFKIQDNKMQEVEERNNELLSQMSALKKENEELIELNKKLQSQLQLAEFGAAVLMSSEDEEKDPAILKFTKKD